MPIKKLYTITTIGKDEIRTNYLGNNTNLYSTAIKWYMEERNKQINTDKLVFIVATHTLTDIYDASQEEPPEYTAQMVLDREIEADSTRIVIKAGSKAEELI